MNISILESTRSPHTCACMIVVRDAQSTIRSALDSVISPGCFQQIIVMLDTRSSDNTERILHEYQRRYPDMIEIIDYEWPEPGDFATVRNEAIKRMSTEYGFWLDGDETIMDPKGLRRLLRHPDGKAYSMWVISPLFSGGSFDMFQPRLFPVVPGVKFECPILERIDWSLRRQGIEIVPTKLRAVHHTGYMDRDVLHQKNQRNKRIGQWWSMLYTFDTEQRDHLTKQMAKLEGLFH